MYIHTCVYMYMYICICVFSLHRLPNGVRTNICFAEVPQYTILMT